MPVKFKLGFTIDAETLFGIISKFLPVSDLSVEEVVEHKSDAAIRFDQRFDLPKPKRAPQVRRKKGSGHELNVHAGANAVIMAMLSDGEQHAVSECFPAMKAAEFSTNGIHTKFQRLQRHGIVEGYKGLWWLSPKGKALWDARSS
jgi:hypothetical protein